MIEPHAVELASSVIAIASLPRDELAILTSHGVTILDRALAPVATMTGEHRARYLAPLPDGRLLAYACRDSFDTASVVARGGGFTPIVRGEETLWHSAAATSTGFVLALEPHVLVDRDGHQTLRAHPRRADHGVVALGAHAAIAGYDGLVLLDGDGAELARFDGKVDHRPTAVAGGLAIAGGDCVTIVDASLATIATLPFAAARDSLVAFADGILHRDGRELALWTWRDGEAACAWRFTRQVELQPPDVAGGRIVVAGWDTSVAWILDVTGALVAEVALPHPFDQACEFGDGIAIVARASHAIAWWRPEGTEALAHDVEVGRLHALDARLISSEANVIYAWDPEQPGPAHPPVAGGPPLDVPLVIDGAIVTVRAAGRFALRGTDANGRAVRVAHDATWRPRIDAAKAGVQFATAIARSTLPTDEILAELASALGVTPRVLVAAFRARRFPLVPPQPVPGYDYLGSFASGGELTICDPCYLGKRSGAFSLVVKAKGREGLWHVFARAGTDASSDRTAELAAIHADGFGVYASERLGAIGVDSGTAGVFDKRYARGEDDVMGHEGTTRGTGAIAWSGHGDGMYDVFAGSIGGQVVKLRIAFLPVGAGEVDGTIGVATSASRAYSARTKFAVGDALAHVKFGPGTVVGVLPGNKIEVAFVDERRVLVHDKA